MAQIKFINLPRIPLRQSSLALCCCNKSAIKWTPVSTPPQEITIWKEAVVVDICWSTRGVAVTVVVYFYRKSRMLVTDHVDTVTGRYMGTILYH